MALVECELIRVVMSESRDHQVIVLREKGGERAMPVLIGPTEARAIHRAVNSIPPPRPLTHELFGQVLDELGAKIERVVVNDLSGSTYFGRIILKVGRHTHDMDSRPSDAIALATQKGAPIFVEESVLERASRDY